MESGVFAPDHKTPAGFLFKAERLPEIKAAIASVAFVSLSVLCGELGITWPIAHRMMKAGVFAPDDRTVYGYFFKVARLPEIRKAVQTHQKAVAERIAAAKVAAKPQLISHYNL